MYRFNYPGPGLGRKNKEEAPFTWPQHQQGGNSRSAIWVRGQVKVGAWSYWFPASQTGSWDMECHFPGKERIWAGVWGGAIPTTYSWTHHTAYVCTKQRLRLPSLLGLGVECDSAVSGWPPGESIVLFGDFDANDNDRVTWRCVTGRNGLPDLNASSDFFLDFCAKTWIVHYNTMFEHKVVPGIPGTKVT